MKFVETASRVSSSSNRPSSRTSEDSSWRPTVPISLSSTAFHRDLSRITIRSPSKVRSEGFTFSTRTDRENLCVSLRVRSLT